MITRFFRALLFVAFLPVALPLALLRFAAAAWRHRHAPLDIRIK